MPRTSRTIALSAALLACGTMTSAVLAQQPPAPTASAVTARPVASGQQLLPPPPAPPSAAVDPLASPIPPSWTFNPAPSNAPSATAGKDSKVEEPVLMEKRWYGWQTLLTDGAAILTIGEVPALSIGTYLLGGPVVHWAHGNVEKGFLSLGIRTAPTLLIYGALSSYDGGSVDNCVSLAVVGVLGVLASIAVDSAAIARDKVPVESPSLALGGVRLIPSVAATGKQTSFVLGGTF